MYGWENPGKTRIIYKDLDELPLQGKIAKFLGAIVVSRYSDEADIFVVASWDALEPRKVQDEAQKVINANPGKHTHLAKYQAPSSCWVHT